MTCDSAHDTSVPLLLQHGADPNENYDTTPLDAACRNGHDTCVSLLLQHRADPNIVDKGTPLHLAVIKYDLTLTLPL